MKQRGPRIPKNGFGDLSFRVWTRKASSFFVANCLVDGMIAKILLKK